VFRSVGRVGDAATAGDPTLVARARTTANDICGLGLGLNLLFSVWGRFREMPCGGFAQESGGGWITHELGDFEAEFGLAAMILSVVHAFGSRSFVLVRPGRANVCSTAPLCRNGIGWC
jgi:hypothetical protein